MSGYSKLPVDATLDASGITIGAVGIKDNAVDNYAKVDTAANLAATDTLLGAHVPVLGAEAGAALTADGSGTIQQYLRSLLKAFGFYDDAAATATGTLSAKVRGLLEAYLARTPTLGQKVAAGSIPVVAASDTTLSVTGDFATESGGHLEETADHVHNIDAVSGTTSGAALTADGTGTLQQYLRSLLKETGWYDDAAATSTGTLSAKLRGMLTVLGATDGAKVVTDATGTVQQYLRGLVTLAAGWTVNTGSIAGTVTANAGTNLNTSALAVETGGHLEETADHCHNIDGVLGTTSDASIDADGTGTIKGALRGLAKAFFARVPALGQSTMAGSVPVTLPSDGSMTATGDFSTETTLAALSAKVTACNTGSVAGTVTANAGTNLNTSALAVETGGHLEETADHVHSIDAKLPDAKTDWTGTGLAKETGGNLATIAGKDFATQTTLSALNGKVTACDTGSVAGTVTANAGTNLNTSALALESGGNLAGLYAGLWLDLSADGVTRLSFDSSAKTAGLTAGKYIICATEDCHVQTGANASVAATTADFFLPKGTPMGALITVTNDAFAAIKETTAGVLCAVKVA